LRVLLDECVDWRLARDLAGHETKTVSDMGWTGITNGALLRLASQQFDVFVTVDQNLSFQQSLIGFDIAVVVIRATRNRLSDLRSLLPQILTAIGSARRGVAEFVDP
jgi:predicted nuclease of predicted toxin-antitoxin system